MSKLWYEYLEESGGEVIPSCYFHHVKKSFTRSKPLKDDILEIIKNNYVLALENVDKKFYVFKVKDVLSSGWLHITFYDDNVSNTWIYLKNKIIKSVFWCYNNKKEFVKFNDELLDDMNKFTEENFSLENCTTLWESVKIGGYMECWVEENLGTVWPVKVVQNIGGRLKLNWFGTSSSQPFYLYFLDYRIRPLGWAKCNHWRYKQPTGMGINISISNADTFVRGGPSAIKKDFLEPEVLPEPHQLEEGWLLETVDPLNPYRVVPGRVESILDDKYYFIKLLDDKSHTHVGFKGLGTVLPANFTGVNGVELSGGKSWNELLGQEGYAPHTEYFNSSINNETISTDMNASEYFLPGCKLEAVYPARKELIMPATITRCLDGSRLVWVHLDADMDYPDILIDPLTSCDIFPVGWCEMVGHALTLPAAYQSPKLSSLSTLKISLPFDCDEISIFLHPHCSLGPFLSRSAAMELLPVKIGPGHCFPVFKELFSLLLKVSHRPLRLMRLLQLDGPSEKHDMMATIAILVPKSDCSSLSTSNFNLVTSNYNCGNGNGNGGSGGGGGGGNSSTGGNNGRICEWLIEVPIRLRAIPEFCRQIALCLGACPSFISSSHYSDERNKENYVSKCFLHCSTRLSAPINQKIGTSGSQARRKRLLQRPLMALGFSYRDLKLRMRGDNSSSCSNSESDTSEHHHNGASAGTAAATAGTTASASAGDGGGGQSNNASSQPPQTTGMCMRTRGLRNDFVASVYTEINSAPRRGKRKNGTANNHNQSDSAVTNAKVEKKEALQDDFTNDSSVKNCAQHQQQQQQQNQPSTPRSHGDMRGALSELQFDSTLYSVDPVYLAAVANNGVSDGPSVSLKLSSNPVLWDVEQVATYFAAIPDCRQFASWLAAEGVDGRALLLLTLPALLSTLQLEPAVRLCRHVTLLKRAFLKQYANQDALLPW